MDNNKPKTEFKIIVMYFKENGKLYVKDTYTKHYEDCGQPGHPCCYMHAVTDDIQQMRKEGTLPGLASGCWNDGFIFVDCDAGYPVLIKPEWVKVKT